MAKQPVDRWVTITLTIWPDRPLDIDLHEAPPWLAIAAFGEAAEQLNDQIDAAKDAAMRTEEEDP